MSFILLLLSWMMLKYSHNKYTISHPRGITYSSLSDYVSAFMYQPIINLALMLMVFISLLIIYSLLVRIVLKNSNIKGYNRLFTILQIPAIIYMVIQGFTYYAEMSMLFLSITIMYLIYKIMKNRRKKIKRITYY